MKDFKPDHAGTPEQEREAAIAGAIAGIQKLRQQKFEKWYGEKILAERRPKFLTAREMYRYILTKRGVEVYGPKGLTLDKWNRKIAKMLCFYFTDDARFETFTDDWGRNMSLKKNLFICGPVGCGKTTLLELFCKNQKQSFIIKSCLRIADDYQKQGIEGVEKYFETIPTYDPFEFYGQTTLGTSFDDLGTEVAKNNYGNKSNIMRDIFFARYEKKFKAGTTHVTTNNAPKEVRLRYGIDDIDQQRIRSRMREMFNIIKFDPEAPDRRK